RRKGAGDGRVQVPGRATAQEWEVAAVAAVACAARAGGDGVAVVEWRAQHSTAHCHRRATDARDAAAVAGLRWRARAPNQGTGEETRVSTGAGRLPAAGPAALAHVACHGARRVGMDDDASA